MNRKIYRKIAKKNGVSVQEVKREMRDAINCAYVNPTQKALSVPRKRTVPTVEEFTAYAVKQIAGKRIISKKKFKKENGWRLILRKTGYIWIAASASPPRKDN